LFLASESLREWIRILRPGFGKNRDKPRKPRLEAIIC
jgi:hypothetical protein